MKYCYNIAMIFRFDPSKDAMLREVRGFGYDDIILSIEAGGLISQTPHPNQEKYPHQEMLYVKMHDGIYMVPCIYESS